MILFAPNAEEPTEDGFEYSEIEPFGNVPADYVSPKARILKNFTDELK